MTRRHMLTFIALSLAGGALAVPTSIAAGSAENLQQRFQQKYSFYHFGNLYVQGPFGWCWEFMGRKEWLV